MSATPHKMSPLVAGSACRIGRPLAAGRQLSSASDDTLQNVGNDSSVSSSVTVR